MIRTIWLDMDNTLMDFSKGNLKKALLDIEDPKYYLTLKPTSKNLIYYLQELKYHDVALRVVSGIPDYANCESVPMYRYPEYYDLVESYKDETIHRYFPNIFRSVDYLSQSVSKAKFVKDSYNTEGSVFIDDMECYINDWKAIINPFAYQVTEQITCEHYLEYLLSKVEGNNGREDFNLR